MALVGLAVVLFFIAVALTAPLLAPYDPLATDWRAVRKPPSGLHVFGTDELGRDVLARLIWGARASLMAGLISVSIAVAVAVPLGLVSGYLGGAIDGLVMRMVDAMLAIPFLILAIALAAFLGPSLANAMIAIGVVQTPIFTRLTRGQVLAVKHEDYIEAARAVGNSHHRIMFRHILPNVLAPILVQATLGTIFLLVSVLGKGTNVENVYLILLDTQILIYFIPYLYLFIIFLIHRRHGDNASETVLAPGGYIGAWLTGLSGMIVTLFAMIIATIPPPDMGNAALFRWKVIGGALGFVLVGGLIYWRARFKEN